MKIALLFALAIIAPIIVGWVCILFAGALAAVFAPVQRAAQRRRKPPEPEPPPVRRSHARHPSLPPLPPSDPRAKLS